MSKFLDRIKEAYTGGRINSYMAERLAKASEFGMTEQLLDDAILDAEDASTLGINNDKDFNIRFFILHFADDMLDDTFGLTIGPEDKHELCRHALHTAKEENFECNDLTDYRLLLHKWLNSRPVKKAYPNIQGKFDKEPEYDIHKWTQAAGAIYDMMKRRKKLSRDDAINALVFDWDADELFKFKNWLRYYESGNTEKYNVKTAKIKKEAFDFTDLNLPDSLLDPNTRSNQLPNVMQRVKNEREQEANDRKEKEEQAKAYKNKARSRLRSLKKLVESLQDMMPDKDLDHVYDEMYALDKSLNKLNIRASIEDRLILSANRMEKFGFVEGAEMLRKVAQEPAAEAPADPANESMIGKDVVESIPDPATNPDPQALNPSDLVNLQTVITRLESVGKKLKSRDTIRELASIDILLNELGMASYFPELTDAQSKLIESYGYASNKVESIVAKLRGTGSTRSVTPKQEQKPMSAEELRSKPVGKVEQKLPTG